MLMLKFELADNRFGRLVQLYTAPRDFEEKIEEAWRNLPSWELLMSWPYCCLGRSAYLECL
jgi:hypothetical protein